MRRKKLIPIFILMTLAAFALYLSFDRALIYILAKSHDLDISYKKHCGGFVYEGMDAVDRKSGIGFSADRAAFKVRWSDGLVIAFDLKKVHFIKTETEKPHDSYDSLMGLVAMPFKGEWIYKEISGEIIPAGEGVTIKNLTAVSDDIRLSLTAAIYNNNTVKGDITIYFAESVMKKVPDELSNVLLSDEKDKWKSLSVHLEGNYKEPSVQVSSKRFRLNIRTIAGTER